MKKILLIISLVFIFTGCQTTTENTNQVTNNQNKNINQIQEPESPDEGEEINWLTYESEDFSFQYPSYVNLMENWESNPDDLSLYVETKKISEIEFGGLNLDKDTALKDLESLKTGSYGEHIGFSLPDSEMVITLDDFFSKGYIVFGRFEICDVTFERNLMFYIVDENNIENSKRVRLVLVGPKDKIINSNSEFFKDSDQCLDVKIWKTDIRENFYTKLTKNEASDEAQEWFTSFVDIINTIEIKKENSNNTFTASDDWNTYKNTNFSISYPSNFYVKEYDDRGINITNFDETVPGSELGLGQLAINVIINPDKDEKEYLSCENDENYEVVKCEDKNINEVTYKYIEFKNDLFDSHNLVIGSFSGNNNIVLYALMDKEDFNNNVDLVNQIFSTLVLD